MSKKLDLSACLILAVCAHAGYALIVGQMSNATTSLAKCTTNGALNA